ncbi:MAG: hypothetical protein ACK5IP_20860 [Paracoccus sp. (in: a-proteobacteria)]
MMRRFAVLAAALVALTGAAHAAPPTKAELLQKAGEGAAACAQSMPDRRQTGEALSAVGYKLDEATGPFKAYTALGKRVVVVITGNKPGNQGCIVLASGMTVPEAEALIQPWVVLTGARPATISDSPAGRFEKGWIGTFKGGPVELGIAKHISTPIVRGAAIVARSVE